MSTTKLDTSGAFQPVTLTSDSTTLSLPSDEVRIRRNGIEFRSPSSMPLWKEMTVALQPPGETKKLTCTGIVVACDGNRHTGYAISILFMNPSRQTQERLNILAHSRLA